jgi:hypothetical protein
VKSQNHRRELQPTILEKFLVGEVEQDFSTGTSSAKHILPLVPRQTSTVTHDTPDDDNVSDDDFFDDDEWHAGLSTTANSRGFEADHNTKTTPACYHTNTFKK